MIYDDIEIPVDNNLLDLNYNHDVENMNDVGDVNVVNMNLNEIFFQNDNIHHEIQNILDNQNDRKQGNQIAGKQERHQTGSDADAQGFGYGVQPAVREKVGGQLFL